MAASDRAALHVVGGGLAGSEAALQLVGFGLPVVLHEMRPVRETPAHRGADLAQIVCSNSLKSTEPATASGAFKAELERLGCRLLPLARETSVPAGSALAVDRERFSALVAARLEAAPHLELRREPVDALPRAAVSPWIVATGPLTGDALRDDLAALTGSAGLHFYDAIAPTLTRESLDLDRLYRAARYDRGEADYLNVPLDREQYDGFIAALLAAEKAGVQDFDRTELFDGCLPVEEIASRGPQTLAHGPLRPVGLHDPRTGRRPHAVVQLRQENAEGTLYGLVGFQTRLKQGEQRRVFRLLPGLENAEFVRYGQLHRNFYLDTPRVLAPDFSLPALPHLRFAGQITGVEGYVESIASGLWTAWNAAAAVFGIALPPLPRTTLLGALLQGFLRDRTGDRLAPMNVHFGLLPPLEDGPRGRRGKRERKLALGARALADLDAWLAAAPVRALLDRRTARC